MARRSYSTVSGGRLSLTERADALFRLHRRWRPRGVGYERYGMLSDIGSMEGTTPVTFVMELRENLVTPHVALHTNGRRSVIAGRTTRHRGCGISQPIRKRVEEALRRLPRRLDQCGLKARAEKSGRKISTEGIIVTRFIKPWGQVRCP